MKATRALRWIGPAMALLFCAVGAFPDQIVTSPNPTGEQRTQVRTVSFTGLGDLPGGDFESRPYAVSADGLVVVGTSASSRADGSGDAFRWTAADGMTDLGDVPQDFFESGAYATSADGSLIGGLWSRRDPRPSGLVTQAILWTQTEGLWVLPGIPADTWASYVFGISADGTVVVGYDNSAFRWTEQTGPVDLGHLEGLPFSAANDVSADGSVVVGLSQSASRTEAWRWTPEDGLVGLGDLPGGPFYSEATAVSADGSVVLGWSRTSASRSDGFRWTAEKGMLPMGHLPGDALGSMAYGVSGDGSVVVGYVTATPTAPEEPWGKAAIWDEVNGMRMLQDVLVNEYGLDLTGWSLSSARDVSDDGCVIVGAGVNPGGDVEAWVAVIPEPAAVTLLVLGGLLALRRRRT